MSMEKNHFPEILRRYTLTVCLPVFQIHPNTENTQIENYNFPIALVFGSENEGISKFWEENSDVKIKIPMENKIDSLNVSVSAAITLYEVNRQNNFKR